MKHQSAVILPSNDIDHSSITCLGGDEIEKLKKGVEEVWRKKYGAGAGLLKRGRGYGTCPI